MPAENLLIVEPATSWVNPTCAPNDTNWVSGTAETAPFKAEIKTRYTAKPAPGTVIPTEDGQFTVQFDQPLRDITPGQAAVAYRGDEAVACGIIKGDGGPVGDFKQIRIIE